MFHQEPTKDALLDAVHVIGWPGFQTCPHELAWHTRHCHKYSVLYFTFNTARSTIIGRLLRQKTSRIPSVYRSVTILLVGLVTSLRRCFRISPADIFHQECLFCNVLNSRVFDMRYAYNPGNDTVSFYDWMYASIAPQSLWY